MGNIVSAVLITLEQVPQLVNHYSDVLRRIKSSPGLPTPHPQEPFYSLEQSKDIPEIPTLKELPDAAEVVIIGSGITAAAVAHTLLTRSDGFNSVLILEARTICGGASGRNGGHIKGETWGDYNELVEAYGDSGAQRVQRFRRTALRDLTVVDKEYCGGKGDVRQVETLDVFYTEEGWLEAQDRLDIWRKAMGESDRQETTHRLWHGVEAQKVKKCPTSLIGCKFMSEQKWNLSSDTRGVIWSKAHVGLMNSYRLVTSLFSYLTTTYPKRFQILPSTSVTSIEVPQSMGHQYVVHTTRGTILTSRIVHATNAHVTHLVPSLRSRVVPVRLSLSAQRPGTVFSKNLEPGTRSWCLYWGSKYSFCSQLPSSPSGWGNGELLFGGGESFAPENGLSELGNTDESSVDPSVASYLSGALPVYFGQSNWGTESAPSEAETGECVGCEPGRVKALWSGIMGLSSDNQPWVGKLPDRRSPHGVLPHIGGEWVSAGFSGEGMVHAWGCGRSLGMMILGQDDLDGEELPKEFLITQDRMKKTGSLKQVLEAFDNQ